MPLQAYAVLEDCENTGGIVFAEHAIVARREGAERYNDGDFSGVTCRRAPWADAFAGKPIPAKVMIAHGWHFECCGCGATIDEDWLHDQDLPLDGVIGVEHSQIYCCEVCEAQENLRRAIARDHQRRAIEALKAFVRKRFPSARFRDDGNWAPHAYAAGRRGTWLVEQSVVAFDFPGMQIGAAQCRLERRQHNDRLIGPIRPEFSCCFGDKEAFEAWAASPESRLKTGAVS
jgi:hypothetical protein